MLSVVCAFYIILSTCVPAGTAFQNIRSSEKVQTTYIAPIGICLNVFARIVFALLIGTV